MIGKIYIFIISLIKMLDNNETILIKIIVKVLPRQQREYRPVSKTRVQLQKQTKHKNRQNRN